MYSSLSLPQLAASLAARFHSKLLRLANPRMCGRTSLLYLLAAQLASSWSLAVKRFCGTSVRPVLLRLPLAQSACTFLPQALQLPFGVWSNSALCLTRSSF